jgi:hypothetical protein
MSWLLLLLLVPLIVVPVVLLLGFVGCGSFDSAPVTAKPDPFLVTHATVDKIGLKWEHPQASSAKFTISRADDAGQPQTIKTDHPSTTFEDVGLADGKVFHYEVVADVGGTKSVPAKTSGITKPKPPFDLEATAQEGTHVDVQWKNASVAKNVRFQLRFRLLPVDPVFKDHSEVATNKGSFSSLVEGREYEFQVVARVTESQNGMVTNVDSAPSNTLKSNTWKRAFGTVLTEADTVRSGSTVVQRIPSSNVQATGGGAVRLTLRGDPALPAARLLRVYISQPSVAAGAQPWDSGLDLKQIDFGPAVEIELDGNSRRSLKTPYQVEAGKDLIIAMDVKPETPARDVPVPRSTINGVTRFQKGAVSEASLADRTGNYNSTPNRLFWIEQIDITDS